MRRQRRGIREDTATGVEIARLIFGKVAGRFTWRTPLKNGNSYQQPGKIQVAQGTYDVLKDRYIFKSKGVINIKGKGEMPVHLLESRLEEESDPVTGAEG